MSQEETMEAQFTRKTGFSGKYSNAFFTSFTNSTSFTIFSGSTRKYGISRMDNIKMFEMLSYSTCN